MLPAFLNTTFADLVDRRSAPVERAQHRAEAVAWLKRAHDASPDDGVSYGYSLRGGWRRSYPETSGYIICTLLSISDRDEDADARARAERIGRWLETVRLEDGSIANPEVDGAAGIVFDTGQVLHGWVSLEALSADADRARAIEAASNWLFERVEADGCFRRNTYRGIVHTYNTRVAWALARAGVLLDRADWRDAAVRNVEWALTQRQGNWFGHCSFDHKSAPFTHTIAYAIRGVLEVGAVTGEERFVDVACEAAGAVAGCLRDDGWLAGQIDEQGQARSRYSCLTGNCQMAIIWLRLAQITGDRQWVEHARSTLRYVMSCQDTGSTEPGMRGAIKGSQPIWGRYSPFTYPNWATKFFLDALLLEELVA